MIKLIALILIAAALSACIVAPDATPRAEALRVAPPGFTPRSLAGQDAVAKDDLTAAQRQANEVAYAIAEATAQAQATIDALNFSVQQSAATATAQSMAINATATKRADDIMATQQAIDAQVKATQTAVSIGAAIEATRQVAHERAVAFDLSAAQNQADQSRARESADIMAWIFRFGAFGIMSLIVVLGYRLAQSFSDAAQSRALAAKLVYDEFGRYFLDRNTQGQVTMTPVQFLNGNVPASQQVLDNDDEEDEPETFLDTRTNTDVERGNNDYWQNEKVCRTNACTLLEASIDYWIAQSIDGQAYNILPSSRNMKQWSTDWRGASKHDWYSKPIAKFFVEAKGEGGRVLVDKNYRSLNELLTAIRRHHAQIDVYGRDMNGKPVPLSPSGSVAK